MSGALTLDSLVTTLACLTSFNSQSSPITINSNQIFDLNNDTLGCPPQSVSFLNLEMRRLREKDQSLTAYVVNLEKKLNDLNERQSYLENYQPLVTKSCVSQPRGFTSIKVDNIGNIIVRCEHEQGMYGSNWLQIANRDSGSFDFLRSWEDYKVGFGALQGEFFIGLQVLHEITSAYIQELLIYLEKSSGEKAYAHYDFFSIGSENEKFALKLLGKYSGTAGDALSYHAGQKFTTKDNDNDKHQQHNCAKIHSGAWWYSECFKSNLFGLYQKDGEPEISDFKGILWQGFLDGPKGSLKVMKMFIRPKGF